MYRKKAVVSPCRESVDSVAEHRLAATLLQMLSQDLYVAVVTQTSCCREVVSGMNTSRSLAYSLRTRSLILHIISFTDKKTGDKLQLMFLDVCF